MSKKRKNVESAGLEALAAIVNPEVDDDVVSAFLGVLYDAPEYTTVTEIGSKIEAAARLTVAADERERVAADNQLKLIGEIQPKVADLQQKLMRWEEDLKKTAYAKEGITVARAIWEGKLPQRIQDAIQAAMQKSPAANRVQEELRGYLAQQEEIQKSNEQAKALVAENRREAALLTKEANELLASIQ